MEDIRVILLGNFQMEIDNQQLDWLDSVKKQSLIAYLFLHPLIQIPRRQIAYLFWSDSSEEQAMANLRNLLFSLRRSDPRMEHFLDIRSHSIQLRDGLSYDLDVQAFENSASNIDSLTELKKAILAYAGELLPGFYDEWVEDQRNRLHALYVQTLERLVYLYEQAGDYPNAILFENRLIENDPCNEKNYRHVMNPARTK